MRRQITITATLFALGTSLSGCGGVLPVVQTQCAEQNASFDATWDCVKRKIAGLRAANPDLLAHYLAVGDLISEKVHNPELSDAQGKFALANELQADTTVADERLRRSFAGLTAAGLAISAASTPPPSVNCVTTATGVIATTHCQ
jgi:hypothetical protein